MYMDCTYLSYIAHLTVYIMYLDGTSAVCEHSQSHYLCTDFTSISALESIRFATLWEHRCVFHGERIVCIVSVTAGATTHTPPNPPPPNIHTHIRTHANCTNYPACDWFHWVPPECSSNHTHTILQPIVRHICGDDVSLGFCPGIPPHLQQPTAPRKPPLKRSQN